MEVKLIKSSQCSCRCFLYRKRTFYSFYDFFRDASQQLSFNKDAIQRPQLQESHCAEPFSYMIYMCHLEQDRSHSESERNKNVKSNSRRMENLNLPQLVI